MSGPVWRRIEGETTSCDLCLGESDPTMVEGGVEDGEFRPWRRLCPDCYENNVELLG